MLEIHEMFNMSWFSTIRLQLGISALHLGPWKWPAGLHKLVPDWRSSHCRKWWIENPWSHSWMKMDWDILGHATRLSWRYKEPNTAKKNAGWLRFYEHQTSIRLILKRKCTSMYFGARFLEQLKRDDYLNWANNYEESYLAARTLPGAGTAQR